MSGMCTGTFHSFSAVVIPMISKPVDEGGLNIDLDQGSWIGMRTCKMMKMKFGLTNVLFSPQPAYFSSVLSWAR